MHVSSHAAQIDVTSFQSRREHSIRPITNQFLLSTHKKVFSSHPMPIFALHHVEWITSKTLWHHGRRRTVRASPVSGFLSRNCQTQAMRNRPRRWLLAGSSTQSILHRSLTRGCWSMVLSRVMLGGMHCMSAFDEAAAGHRLRCVHLHPEVCTSKNGCRAGGRHREMMVVRVSIHGEGRERRVRR